MFLRAGILITVFALSLITLPAYARLDILGIWQVLYPDSNAVDIGGSGCQICHQSAMGNEPWNAYGWGIRERIHSGFTIEQSIRFVGGEDPDGNNVESIDEISNDFQPGWTAGNNNTIYCESVMAMNPCSGSATLPNQPPPDPLPESTALDFPLAVNNPIPDAILGSATILDLVEVANNFNAPVKAVKAPGIDGSLFVVEQTGKIFRVDLSTGQKTLFLNVSNRLADINSGYDERGLLGLEFHPDYANNGLFYTYQSEPVRTVDDNNVDFTVANPNHRAFITEHKASDPSCNSSISEKKDLLIIDQPEANHNGGDLAFDQNGYLYISLGDGGGANDRGDGHGVRGNGRDKASPLGAILRIDPLGSNSQNTKYGIPNSNPFVGQSGVDEIYAYGFRNPYRISFDKNTDELYAADVGQNKIEEIDFVTIGGNYGWNWKEGSFAFYSSNSSGTYVSNVDHPGQPNDLIDPIGEYGRQDGIAVTGGYVYRGSTIGDKNGDYIFGDFSGPSIQTATGRIFSLDVTNGDIEEFGLANNINGYITAFGQDADNELYVLVNDQFNPSGQQGRLMKLVETGNTVSPPVSIGESAQCPPSEGLCFPINAVSGNISLICL
ncbi:MAG: PQQ-dependent sugar dehydrogenase [Arenicella sp.]|jgi:glucose/arabinose dehydrogenase|nr:PQQ-dependent sugar dehydrogenase [Arenicella sp.]